MPDSEEEVGEIVVTGDRLPVDTHPGIAGGPYWFGGGGEGGGEGGGGDDFYFVPPEPEGDEGAIIIVVPREHAEDHPAAQNEAETGPQIIVTPSEGQAFEPIPSWDQHLF